MPRILVKSVRSRSFDHLAYSLRAADAFLLSELVDLCE